MDRASIAKRMKTGEDQYGGSPQRQTRQLAESKERKMREEHLGSETSSREADEDWQKSMRVRARGASGSSIK